MSPRRRSCGSQNAGSFRAPEGARYTFTLRINVVPGADLQQFHRHADHFPQAEFGAADLAPLTITRRVDRAGQTVFSTDDDSMRSAVNACKDELARRGVPATASVAHARDHLYGRQFTDRTIRTAVRERRTATLTPQTCTTCGHPMTSLGDGATTHPGCEDNR